MSNQEQQDPDVKPDEVEAKADDPLKVLSPEARKIFEETQAGLLSALEKEREANKESQKRAAALEKAAQDAEKKRLQEQQDYKSLYEKTEGELSQVKAQAEKVEAYESTLKEILAVEIEGIPAEKRSLIPGDLSVEAQLRYISKNRSLLVRSKAFDIGAGIRGGNEPDSVELTEEQKSFAQKMGVKPEDYAKNIKK